MLAFRRRRIAGSIAAPGSASAASNGGADGAGGGAGDGGGGSEIQGSGDAPGPRDPGRPRVYKLRLALILAGLGGLAIVSTVFGMMMAVAADLPALENRQEYRNARNSTLYDIRGEQLGLLTSRLNRILVQPGQVSASMQHAIIAIEDQRFYENNGVDLRGVGRALIADLARKRAVQGASTITQQFVKNALAAQHERTLFQKLREAALAYHLNRKWSKQKILAEYLNAVYFGNGAYGIESAARTYFQTAFTTAGIECGTEKHLPCAALLSPAQSALIAGVVASPSAFDPVAHPQAARQRRNLVLARMAAQGYLSDKERRDAEASALPALSEITFPREDSAAPYFTTWVKQQVIQQFGAQSALSGGLRIRTTLDLDLQRAAEQAVANHLPSSDGPAAAVVVIDNRTGEVRAMTSGRPGVTYKDAPFNLATQGQRQPGSSFKVFTLAQALRDGISPESTWESRKKVFDVPGSGGKEKFVVNNYEDQYSGVSSLANATTRSDNSVFAEVGIKVGPPRVAALARQFGISTPISTNPAMILGGLKQGVTPLDMAHAYETLAAGGKRVTGTLAAKRGDPVGIHEVVEPGRHPVTRLNEPRRRKVVSKKLADTETEILKSVVCCGTGKAAATDGFAAGKTGTTENYGDAWFVGFNKRWTVAVWVGYPDRVKPMETDFNGGPVAGGTFPALIWHDFVVAADQIQNQREAERAAREGREYTPPDESAGTEGGDAGAPAGATDGGETSAPSDAGPSQPTPSSGSSPSAGGGDGGGGGGPAPTPPARPAPSAGGDGGGGSGGAPGAPGGTAPQG